MLTKARKIFETTMQKMRNHFIFKNGDIYIIINSTFVKQRQMQKQKSLQLKITVKIEKKHIIT